MKENNHPTRKPSRLNRFDYSANYAYFITICCQDKKHLLGKIVSGKSFDEPSGQFVGDDACDVPRAALSRYGCIVQKYIHLMDNKYYNAFVDKYVIMPNHIHFILIVSTADRSAYSGTTRVGYYGTSQASSPTNTNEKRELIQSNYRQHEIVPKFVSLLKRYINHEIGYNIWQRGYYDHIIRNEDDYRNTWLYIDNNPARWAEDEYY